MISETTQRPAIQEQHQMQLDLIENHTRCQIDWLYW